MALIYTKLTDKTTILAPRQGGGRKFNFGDDWTEVRMGVFASAVAATGSNDDNVNETLVPSGITDYITFGLKDDSQTYPGMAGSLFIGLRNASTNTDSFGPATGFGTSGGAWLAVGYHDATLVNGGGGTMQTGTLGAARASLASGYAAFMAVKIVISNRGLSSQSVACTTAFSGISGTDYSASALRTQLNNASYTGSASFAWNDGATARDIPDCPWVRVPLFNNQLRISCIRAIRYAP